MKTITPSEQNFIDHFADVNGGTLIGELNYTYLQIYKIVSPEEYQKEFEVFCDENLTYQCEYCGNIFDTVFEANKCTHHNENEYKERLEEGR